MNSILIRRRARHVLPVYSRFIQLQSRNASSYDADFSTFKEEDVVLLKSPDSSQSPQMFLTKPLRPNSILETHRGAFKHTDIIGQAPRSLIKSSSGRPMRLHFPTLAEYVSITPRLVTPVYAGEANIITSLLDIHPQTCDHETSPVEVLEAGTGHGSLTLHLARALSVNTQSIAHPPILHTLDISERYSEHAQRVVTRFRRGLYAEHVQFHVGEIPNWIADQFDRRQKSNAFLKYVVLDLPDVDQALKFVAPAIRPDGTVAVFCPSITQIAGCVDIIKRLNLPFAMDRVVELGSNLSSGKPWDVRAFTPRSRKPLKPDTTQEDEDTSLASFDESPFQSNGPTKETEDTWKMVCKPQLGYMVHAGGFLGLWKREL